MQFSMHRHRLCETNIVATLSLSPETPTLFFFQDFLRSKFSPFHSILETFYSSEKEEKKFSPPVFLGGIFVFFCDRISRHFRQFRKLFGFFLRWGQKQKYPSPTPCFLGGNFCLIFRSKFSPFQAILSNDPPLRVPNCLNIFLFIVSLYISRKCQKKMYANRVHNLGETTDFS
jgi:hypothetical protein